MLPTYAARAWMKNRIHQKAIICALAYNKAATSYKEQDKFPALSCKPMIAKRYFQSTSPLPDNKVTINFVDRHGKTHKAKATVGDSLLDAVIDNDLLFETYGVCEGTVSCSTCHVILDESTYNDLEEPLMDEMDMLDLACGLTETSRLGCQVHVTKKMDGITVMLPKEITDARDL